MRQSSVIFFYLFAAFLIFITMRGALPIYAGFLLASPKPKTAPVVTGETKVGANPFAKAASFIAEHPETLEAV